MSRPQAGATSSLCGQWIATCPTSRRAPAGNAGSITVHMTGLGLAESGITAKLARSGVPDRAATEVTRESATALLARFDLTGAAAGIYDVVLAWPDGHTETLPAAFEVTPGIGPKLETKITAPESVRPGRQYMVHVDYSNTGDADMAAPLLRITAENADLKLPEEDKLHRVDDSDLRDQRRDPGERVATRGHRAAQPRVPAAKHRRVGAVHGK